MYLSEYSKTGMEKTSGVDEDTVESEIFRLTTGSLQAASAISPSRVHPVGKQL